MLGNFPNCFDKTLVHEGGYVNHPKDPGGATNYGIIQRTYDAWRRRKGRMKRSVKMISTDEVRAIYREDYWDPIRGDDLPAGLDYVTYDAGVNSGIGRGPKWTQRALGVTQDSKVGPRTIRAANLVANDGRDALAKVIKDACHFRLGFLKGLRHWSTFGRGWTRRVHGVEAGALAMVQSPDYIANEAKVSNKRAKTEAASGTAGAGGSGLGLENLPEIMPDWSAYLGYALIGIVAVIVIRRVMSERDRAAAMNAEVAAIEATLEGTPDA